MNVDNRTLFIADNLDIMRGMDSNTVDLIYLDPPFNTKKNYKAPIGSPAEGAEFKDIWTDEDIKDEWHGQIAAEHEELYQVIQASETVYDRSMRIYLTAMAVRLFEMHRILKPTGSIYLHCDPTASHYLKTVMDDIFGKQNFRNEIVWQRTSAHNDGNRLGRVHDIILFYSKSQQPLWNPVYTAHDPEYIERFYRYEDERGRYRVSDLTAAGVTQRGESGQTWRGVDPTAVGRHWAIPRRDSWPEDVQPPENYESLLVQERLDALDANGLIYWPPRGRVPGFRRYLSTSRGRRVHDVITDINPLSGQSRERTGYPTQKPLALLDRVIKASSNEGDIVLDPFCGCATACVAAERLHRHWVGIDISPSAEDITKLRLTEEVDEASDLFNPLTDVIVRKDAPERTDNAEEKAVQMNLPAYQTHKPELFGRQEGKCNGCQDFFRFRNLTVDHIIPQSKDGTDHIGNLQLLCAACNSTKGNRSHDELIQTLKATGVLRD